MTLYEDLWRLWKDYIDYYVVGNVHLKRVFFHALLGTWLTYKGISYVESSERRSMRVHIFAIQDSGTGKSQLMKAYHKLLMYLGFSREQADWTIKDNEASLTGTVFQDEKGKHIILKGSLSKLYSLVWDEGSVLLKPSAYMDILTDVFQGVMDEPGEVSKGMRFGKINYPCFTTITAGSYMFDAFKRTLLTKGFLQRMYISYKKFTEKEKRDIRIGVNLLKLGQESEKIEKIRSAFKRTLNKIPEPSGRAISFNIDSVRLFDLEIEKAYREYIEYQFSGDKQETLETFFHRIHVLVDKIAAQRAIINGKKEVTYEDMMYALGECKWHLESLLSIFDYFFAGKIVTSYEKREQTVEGIIKQFNGEISQAGVLQQLRILKQQGRWDLGYNRSLSLLEQMEAGHLIFAKKEGKNKKIYFLQSQ